MRSESVASLSVDGPLSCFEFGDSRIRFRTSDHLRRYVSVKQWDNGYIVVDADYDGKNVEEYIDLVPILRNLYRDPETFCAPIKEVVAR